jgi:Domain of unknown function (DUF397)
MNELNWFKSSYSSGNGACVECALLPGGAMAVRDTQNRDGAVLAIRAGAWQAFTGGLK